MATHAINFRSFLNDKDVSAVQVECEDHTDPTWYHLDSYLTITGPTDSYFLDFSFLCEAKEADSEAAEVFETHLKTIETLQTSLSMVESWLRAARDRHFGPRSS